MSFEGTSPLCHNWFALDLYYHNRSKRTVPLGPRRNVEKGGPLDSSQKRYVFCPFCGDPVPGPFPRSGEFVACGHCYSEFPFDDQVMQSGVLEYNKEAKRWQAAL